ncbi:head-tail adaptor protein [Aminobacter sp. NyZ550]|uniref:head-tail adaptor protein n=1 Tax=Aminobacter sp. NyZ550 TaxID=2979870 RepID=UPI0021D602FC|nr:head-tail adaptor protein [Aminobacter sp. NyZ550]WAX93192.1 head-tail adaptor protein [Aminobacter sp. NyZ550]
MRGAGQLRNRVNCQFKGPATDEFGNPVPGGAVWQTAFSVRAGFRPRNGGEAVMAGRLQGVQPYIVTVRQSSNTRQITPTWRLVDANDATRIFNVRSLADPDNQGAWLELLVEQGVAS